MIFAIKNLLVLIFSGGPMFKKITALLLLTAFTNVYAFTPVLQSNARSEELSKTFDSLNYKLNVDWDQKDPGFFADAISGFEDDIGVLQASGLTKDELVKYTLEKIKDKEVKNEINELGKMLGDSQMTNEEARAFIITKLNSTYAHGASWSGSHMGHHTAFIVGIIIVVLVIANHHGSQGEPTPVRTPNDCSYPTYLNCYQYPVGVSAGF
jgi:hypothetical protein